LSNTDKITLCVIKSCTVQYKIVQNVYEYRCMDDIRINVYVCRFWFWRLALRKFKKQHFPRLSRRIQLVYCIWCIFSHSYWCFSWN